MRSRKAEKLLEPKPFIACGYAEACGREAFCSIRLPDRDRVNICRNHYHAHFAGTARAFCEKNGLDTVPKMREFCRVKVAEFLTKQPSRDWARRIAERAARGEKFSPIALEYAAQTLRRQVPLVEREPGSDDEEVAA